MEQRRRLWIHRYESIFILLPASQFVYVTCSIKSDTIYIPQHLQTADPFSHQHITRHHAALSSASITERAQPHHHPHPSVRIFVYPQTHRFDPFFQPSYPWSNNNNTERKYVCRMRYRQTRARVVFALAAADACDALCILKGAGWGLLHEVQFVSTDIYQAYRSDSVRSNRK